jgi:hypothetical protein
MRKAKWCGGAANMTLNKDSVMDAEFARVNAATRQMLNAYLQWGQEVKGGDVTLGIYGNVIDFVNFRLETAQSCLQLIQESKIGDALGLSRSLLENYLLLIAICRGPVHFQLRDLSEKTPDEFKLALDEQIRILEGLKSQNKTTCLDVRAYRRAKRHMMYIFPGIIDSDGELLPVSVHYFHFQEFRPETMRLKPSDYFEYYEPDEDLKKALKGHKREATFRYQHFLSYEALLECLDLNGLANDAIRARIDAHYTFLGQYLHPTSDAMRILHDRSNVYHGKPSIGMSSNYSETSKLMSSLYVCYLVAGILSEVCSLFEAAKPKYIQNAGTGTLRSIVEAVTRSSMKRLYMIVSIGLLTMQRMIR